MPALSYALVLYCHDPDRTRAFYEACGLSFAAEKHGDGPNHFAADLGGFAIELYPAASSGHAWTPPYQQKASRLVVPISDIRATMAELAAQHAPMAGPKASSLGRTLLTADPDGREVLLIESS